LARRYWNSGYATEMARALIEHGFLQVGLAEILAVTIPENQASLRVLQKAGFGYRGRGLYHGTHVVVHGVTHNPGACGR
jgi:ribosomal-protein-alanine N-acetyltransferase